MKMSAMNHGPGIVDGNCIKINQIEKTGMI